ncbi:hypothetical protein PVW48_09845 [Dinoroseobacter sp. PD6]|nr:hypothetical protein [Dinoroseobacter sp. PD6]MDD9717047.1 hypothetical protein [Dinoroseobacter sp. PD6]
MVLWCGFNPEGPPMRRIYPCLALPVAGLLAACAPPPPEAFDKHPVGATSTAIAAKRAEQAAIADYVEPAPRYAFSSGDGMPVSSDLAAARAMEAGSAAPGVAMKVSGEILDVAQVRYDGQDFLVGTVTDGAAAFDLSEAFKSLAPSVTLCSATGPVWQSGARYAAALSCL